MLGKTPHLLGPAVDNLLEYIPGFLKLKQDKSLDEATLQKHEGLLRQKASPY